MTARSIPPTTPSAAGRGFTVVELLVVIFIIAIAAGLVAPVIGGAVRFSALRAGASRASTGLQRARNLAIMNGEIYCFRLLAKASDEVSQETAIYKLNSVTEPAFVSWQDLENADREVGGYTLPREVVASFAGGQSYVIFLPDGSAWRQGMLPSSSMTVRLLDAYQVTGTSNTRQVIGIGSLSGRIIVGDRED